MRTNRRRFLGASAAGGALVGLGELGFLSRLGPVSAGEAKLDPKVVRLQPEIEPLVRLLEETPRNRLLEEVAGRIHKGLSYREVLAALLLAGVRNVQPRPSVGHKFHAVLVVNSAHLASLGSPDTDRWLPIFWALDYFKSSQAQDVREGNWTMGPVDESAVPPSGRAREAFVAAMDRWDESAADAATAGLARTAGANEVYELFFRYGARDFRSIGHKAIYVANSWRTLQCIGWQHAEPILRSLAYALLMHEDGNPAQRDDPADRSWRHNQSRAARIKEGWYAGKPDSAASADLLTTLRKGSEDDACEQVVELLNRGVAPQSIWDALFDGAGELLLRQPGIVSLHAVTSTNALHYAYQASGDDLTRRLLMLQNAAFLTLFRGALGGRGRVRDARIDQLEPAGTSKSKDCAEAVAEIFAEASRDKLAAARQALAYLQAGHEPEPLIHAARRLVFLKGDDPHDYKFSSAVLEDYYHASPAYRERYLAASLLLLPGSADRDNNLVKRTRAALEA
ncbi:MAG TPA: twin-arginine translocation signal domain-containing protein [Isosphaeraceae bacterium]|nr:twin-arginine translocation signal domain-containing protein [Isosphaeraceae bacterium]